MKGKFHLSLSHHQKIILSSIHECAEARGVLLLEAPTGAGKTFLSLSATLSYAKENSLKVIYVARTHRECDKVLMELERIGKYGKYSVKGICLTGRSKICPSITHEDALSFLKCRLLRRLNACVYYNRFLSGFDEFLEETELSRRISLDSAHVSLCPYYALRLLIDFCDVVAAPYFYVFGPFSYDLLFRSATINPLKSILIVDEAHNLINFVFQSNKFSLTIREVENAERESKKLNLHIEETLNSIKNLFKKKGELKWKEVAHHFCELYEVLKVTFLPTLESLFSRSLPSPRDLCKLFLFTRELITPSNNVKRVLYLAKNPPSLFISPIKISDFVGDIISPFHSVIFMSATLSPIPIYKTLFGINSLKRRYKRYVQLKEVPFKYSVKTYFLSDITTRYADRSYTLYERISKILTAIFERFTESGLIAFFPSKEMKNAILALTSFEHEGRIILTEDRFSSLKRLNLELKKRLNERDKIVIFAVIGGRLSEGIDLPFLDTICIVGLPLPPPTVDERLKAKLFQEELGLNAGRARLYSYVMPALDKSIHAVGRLLRGCSRRIKIFLLDYRFLYSQHLYFLPSWLRKNSKKISVSSLIGV